MKTNFKDVLTQNKSEVEKGLKKIFDSRAESISKDLRDAREMVDAASEFVLMGGKRLRPFLARISHSLYGDLSSSFANDDLLRIACSVELVHAYLLVHDDIMDRSSIRHGGDTVHKKYSDESGEFYGNSMGILVGDFLNSMASSLFLEAGGFSKDSLLTSSKKLHETVMETIYGQQLDVLFEEFGIVPTEDVLKMLKLKTSKYTVENPLHIGALLAGGGKEDLNLLSKFSTPSGLIFQLKDDYLDIFGQEKFGKPLGNDIKQGKQTLFVTYVLENGTSAQKETLRKSLGDDTLDGEGLEEIKKVFIDSGALKFVENMMGEYYEEAKGTLEEFKSRGWNVESVGILREFLDFIMYRDH